MNGKVKTLRKGKRGNGYCRERGVKERKGVRSCVSGWGIIVWQRTCSSELRSVWGLVQRNKVDYT